MSSFLPPVRVPVNCQARFVAESDLHRFRDPRWRFSRRGYTWDQRQDDPGPLARRHDHLVSSLTLRTRSTTHNIMFCGKSWDDDR